MALSICVVGGCHVDGFVIDPELAFAAVLRATLRERHADTTVRKLSLVRFKDRTKVETLLDETSPDVLVLQMGNHEGGPSLFSRFKRKRGKSSTQTTQSTWVRPDWAHDASYRRTASHLFRGMGRLAAYPILGRNLVDVNRHRNDATAFFDMVAARRIPKVIVLTPFPAMDPVVRIFRSKVGGIVTATAAGRGFVVLDSFELLDRPELFFPDGNHLNSLGHSRLAHELATHIAARRDMTGDVRRLAHG